MIRLILFAYLALIAVLLVSTELSKNSESNRMRLALHHNDLAEHQPPHIFRHHG